jgi:Domain of unknown function (DUF4352)
VTNYAPPPVPPTYPQGGQAQPPYAPAPGQQFGPPHGQAAYGAPQPPKKKPFYKRTWFLVLAGLTVLAIIMNAVNGGETETAEPAAAVAEPPAVAEGDAAPAAPAAPEDDTFAIGEAAPDGDFSFVVSKVDCGLTEIGDQYFGTTAQGQFCVVDVAVTNIGDTAGAFFGDNSKLLNAEGQEFSADSEAAIYLENSDSLFEEINPGNTLNSKIVFDVPAGTTPTSIELHDSAFSGGVTVALQ